MSTGSSIAEKKAHVARLREEIRVLEQEIINDRKVQIKELIKSMTDEDLELFVEMAQDYLET